MPATTEHHRTAVSKPGRIHHGLDAVVYGLMGNWARRPVLLKNLKERGEFVHHAASQLTHLSDRVLRERLNVSRLHIRRHRKVSESLINESMASIVEAARRELGLSPYPVQITAALAASLGFLLEMATGEGKTLTVSLAAVLAGWTGRPCHVITANDYLAARDAAWLGDFYKSCGLTVACVTGEMKSPQRRAGYSADITYTTSKEAAADFLRDRLQLGPLTDSTRRSLRNMLQPRAAAQDSLVMRGLHIAIVDEADSALVDEAVTPLLISRPRENKELNDACLTAHQLSHALILDTDFTIDPQTQEVTFKPPGLDKMEARLSELPPMWQGLERRLELISQALRARELFHLGKQYVIEEGKIVIVDEFTGRLMHQRTWREGLHQAVEAKEGIEITPPAETLARLSFQRFFRLYHNLSGLSGTVFEAAPELWQLYRLPVIRIPTHRPCVRIEMADQIFAREKDKWAAVVEEILARHQKNQPVLVGTRSVAASEQLSQWLDDKGLQYNLLNATRHKDEANIIAAAGQPGAITIATNMAGRGTDIKLGRGIQELGGLHVILTERHESRRIDRQLMGRAARQGDPGSSQAFVSIEDELIRKHSPAWLNARVRGLLIHNSPGALFMASQLIEKAQARAETRAFKQRRAVMSMDTWVEESLAFAGPSLEE